MISGKYKEQLIFCCRLNVSWDAKQIFFWNKITGKTEGNIKMIDLAKTHCSITVVAYSRKYRVSA